MLIIQTELRDSWREFNIRATTEDTGFKDALAILKDESLEALYQKVLAGEVPMDYFMSVAVEKLKGVDNQRLQNEIGMGLFGDKWLEVGGDAVTASVEMIGKDSKSGLKGVDTKLGETEGEVIINVLRNEIGMGLFGDKWLEVGGEAVTASVEMIGKER